MTARSRLRGHPIEWHGDRWIYSDTGEPTAGNPRPCGRCGLPDTDDGHDGCLGTLTGVRNACCGHGVTREAYVQFWGGVTVRGRVARVCLPQTKEAAGPRRIRRQALG